MGELINLDENRGLAPDDPRRHNGGIVVYYGRDGATEFVLGSGFPAAAQIIEDEIATMYGLGVIQLIREPVAKAVTVLRAIADKRGIPFDIIDDRVQARRGG